MSIHVHTIAFIGENNLNVHGLKDLDVPAVDHPGRHEAREIDHYLGQRGLDRMNAAMPAVSAFITVCFCSEQICGAPPHAEPLEHQHRVCPLRCHEWHA